MPINLSLLNFESTYSGFGNYTQTTLSFNVPSTSVGTSPTILTASTLISNADSLSQVEAQLTGLDNTWYVFKGFMGNFYTSGNVWTNNVATASYEIDLNSSYTASQFQLLISLFNLSLNPTFTVPAFTINCNISLYIAPFS